MKTNHLVAFACAFSCMVIHPAHAAASIRDEPEVARCIRQAAQGSVWLEKTLWGLRDQEAGWVGAEVANTNGTHDLGPFQINSAWIPRIAHIVGRSAAQVQDRLIWEPCFNTEVARWIYMSELGKAQDYWKAVGTFHSPTIWKQRRYSAEVARHMRRRFGDEVFNLGRDQAKPPVHLRTNAPSDERSRPR